MHDFTILLTFIATVFAPCLMAHSATRSATESSEERFRQLRTRGRQRYALADESRRDIAPASRARDAQEAVQAWRDYYAGIQVPSQRNVPEADLTMESGEAPLLVVN